MSSIFLKALVFLAIAVAVFLGVRRIWRDWSGQFKAVDKAVDKARHARDLAERKRPDVIELKRNKDGVFRPGGDESDRH